MDTSYIDQVRNVALAVLPRVEAWRADWIAALAALESGWGRHVPEGSNNPFGYHWVDGSGWPYVETIEAGTGRAQRYRRFESLAHAIQAVYYLMESSSLPGYRNARATYEAHQTQTRRAFVADFSRQYCPVNPAHGSRVLTLMDQIADMQQADYAADDGGRVKGT